MYVTIKKTRTKSITIKNNIIHPLFLKISFGLGLKLCEIKIFSKTLVLFEMTSFLRKIDRPVYIYMRTSLTLIFNAKTLSLKMMQQAIENGY